MSLKTYEEKRNFDITPEPSPEGKPKGKAGEPIFVVQQHQATTLHYDFRLEADGVLKSWAVTKEPALDPTIRRLAVAVEDHPVAYADFSGDIPEGEYGAGHVEIWDRGTYRNLMADKDEPMTLAESIEAGHVEIELDGERLKGAFVLIRMKGGAGRNWLLIKKKDAGARSGSADGSIGHHGDGHQKPAAGKSHARSVRADRTSAPPEEVEFTSTDKPMFPEAGLTKGDLIEYYERIADRLLPHLQDRPMTLERLPDGLTSAKAPHFWQKDTPEHYPEWIPRVKLQTEGGKMVDYVLVNDRQTLLYLVNQGTVTFHPWLSRISSLDRPDFVLFDLDPGETTFADAITVARTLHTILDADGNESYVKTSGKSGLHVLVPWTRRGEYEEAREWALRIASQVADALPDLVTIERRKEDRGGRLYLDVMQNVRGHHAVPPYVVRAVPHATVSTPLRWEELTADLTPERFDTRTIFRRIAHQKLDPIAPLAESFTSAGGKR